MFVKKLIEGIHKATDEYNIGNANDFQKAVLSKIKSGADTVLLSDKSDEKNLVLCIGIIQQLQAEKDDVPRALVMVDNEEEANRIEDFLKKLAKYTTLRIFSAFSGFNSAERNEDHQQDIYMGSDIVVGTPSKLGELYTNNTLNISGLKILSILEADAIFKVKEISQIERFLNAVPDTQIILSATKMHERIMRYEEEFMKSAWIINAEDYL